MLRNSLSSLVFAPFTSPSSSSSCPSRAQSVTFLMIPILTLTPPTPVPSPSPSSSPSKSFDFRPISHGSPRSSCFETCESDAVTATVTAWTGSRGEQQRRRRLGERRSSDSIEPTFVIASDVDIVRTAATTVSSRLAAASVVVPGTRRFARDFDPRDDRPFANFARIRQNDERGTDGNDDVDGKPQGRSRESKARHEAKKASEVVRVDKRLDDALKGFGW